MAKKYQNYTPEFRMETAKLIVEGPRPIAEVAREYGINETTVGNWVRQYREDHPSDDPPLQLSDRARLAQLERENRDLVMENAFLKKAAAYFAKDHR